MTRMSRIAIAGSIVVVAGGLVVGVLVSGVLGFASPSDAPKIPSVAATIGDSTAPRIVTEAELREFGANNAPVYWAGPRVGTVYELTVAATGMVFVRYLDAETGTGDDTDEFLTIATYATADGFADLARESGATGSTATMSANGALIVTSATAPRSVYFGFKDAALQVEVFAPDQAEALALVAAGAIEVLR